MSIYQQFARTWNDGQSGFGRHSYNDAIAAGYTPAQIASAVSGQRVGQRAQDMIAAAQPAYSSGRSSARDDYQGVIDGLNSQIGGYTNQISGLNNQINEYTTRVNTLTNQYDDALKTIDEVETCLLYTSPSPRDS